MALPCAVCAAVLPDGAKFCMTCGAPAGGAAPAPGEEWAGGVPPPPAPRKMSTGMIVLIVLGCLVLCGIPGLAIVAAIAIPNLLAAKLSANETAAIATCRNLCSCQAQIQASGKIDVDEDGIGEYGTFLEMTGTVGVRTKAGRGAPVSPPVLSSSLANVDSRGIVVKSGYAYILYLPDATGKGWVHETGGTSLSGPVGTDEAEVRWCVYAWPVVRGNTGNRCFFVNEAGDVFQSANEMARHSGTMAPPAPDSMSPGHGQVGGDGDVWKIVN
jgi:hypothetical protein